MNIFRKATAAFDRLYLRGGISPSLSHQVNKRIRICNIFSMVLGTMVAPYTYLFWRADIPSLAIGCVPTALFYWLLPLANRWGWTNFSRLAFTTIAHLVVGAYAMTLGPPAGIHVLFILTASYAVLLFDATEKWKQLYSLTISFICVLGFHAYYSGGNEIPAPMPQEVYNFLSPAVFVTTFTLVSTILYFYYRASTVAEADAMALAYTTIYASPIGVAVYRETGECEVANDAMGKIARVDANTLATSTMNELKIWKDLQLVERMQRSLANKETLRADVHLQRDEGSIRAEIFMVPYVSEGIARLLMMAVDTTDRAKMEEVMIQSEKMATVGGLAAGMAHEINNPLAGITQNLQLLGLRLDPDSAKNQAAARAVGVEMAGIHKYAIARQVMVALDAANESAARAAKIVDNMLSFARKPAPFRVYQDLGALLDAAVELVAADYDLKNNYDFKRIEIVREYEEPPGLVLCDPGKMQQVFLNILKNGADAMRATDDVVSPPRFILRVKQMNQTSRVEIENNGPGIPESVRLRIFEPFFTTKAVGKGTGLGLSVSYFIITQNHGGKMQVISNPNGGAKFVIELPSGEQPVTGR